MTDDRTRHEADDDARGARAIADMVSRIEWARAILFLIVAVICVGVPLLRGIVHGHPLLGLAAAILLGLVGLVLLFLINLFVLIPITVIRFERAAKSLRRQLELLTPAPVLCRSWTDRAPGAITISADRRVWLADRSTGYRPVMLMVDDILGSDTIIMSSALRRRLRGPAIGLGVPVGGGVIMTVSIGRKGAPAPVRVRHAVRLRYRGTAGDHVTLIPFSGDANGARVLAALLAAAIPAA